MRETAFAAPGPFGKYASVLLHSEVTDLATGADVSAGNDTGLNGYFAVALMLEVPSESGTLYRDCR